MRPSVLLVCGTLAWAIACAGDYSAQLAASRATSAEFMQTLKREL